MTRNKDIIKTEFKHTPMDNIGNNLIALMFILVILGIYTGISSLIAYLVNRSIAKRRL